MAQVRVLTAEVVRSCQMQDRIGKKYMQDLLSNWRSVGRESRMTPGFLTRTCRSLEGRKDEGFKCGCDQLEISIRNLRGDVMEAVR